MTTNTAIGLFAYDRPKHLKKTLEALRKNTGVERYTLHLFADGLPNNASSRLGQRVAQVHNMLHDLEWPGKIERHFQQSHVGLAQSLVEGVTAMFESADRVIVLEDDIVTAPGFLKFHLEALDKYAGDKRIYGISGYSHDAPFPESLGPQYFLRMISTWGWSTWKDRWEGFNPHEANLLEKLTQLSDASHFDLSNRNFTAMLRHTESGNLDSWGVKWYLHVFRNKGLYLYPKHSLVKNIGFDGKGRNAEKVHFYTHGNFSDHVELAEVVVEESAEARAAIDRFFAGFSKAMNQPSRLKRLWQKLR